MPANTPITRQAPSRTFVVAAAVLGVVAVAQLGAVAWRFLKTEPVANSDGVRIPPEKIDVSKILSEMPPPPDEPLAAIDPLDSDPVAISATGARPVPVRAEPIPEAKPLNPATAPVLPASSALPARPTPVPIAALTQKVDPRFNELIEQGKLLRASGDTGGALVKFREAEVLAPGHAVAIAEQAFTFEKMTLTDQAAAQWKRILAMGENAGALYSAAKAKLDSAIADTVRQTTPSVSPAAVGEGKILGLGDPVIDDDEDPAATRKFTMRVPIRAAAGSQIVVRNMKIFVQFYDRINGRDLATTAANVKNRWSDPPADWAGSDTETLEVDYDLPRFEGRGERRDYHGCVVRLYYNGQLQDVHAEPAALLQRFQPPQTISE
jgi:hypothetical protein